VKTVTYRPYDYFVRHKESTAMTINYTEKSRQLFTERLRYVTTTNTTTNNKTKIPNPNVVGEITHTEFNFHQTKAELNNLR
jgi:hypothetical protein